jgi:hypothetical protein
LAAAAHLIRQAITRLFHCLLPQPQPEAVQVKAVKLGLQLMADLAAAQQLGKLRLVLARLGKVITVVRALRRLTIPAAAAAELAASAEMLLRPMAALAARGRLVV